MAFLCFRISRSLPMPAIMLPPLPPLFMNDHFLDRCLSSDWQEVDSFFTISMISSLLSQVRERAAFLNALSACVLLSDQLVLGLLAELMTPLPIVVVLFPLPLFFRPSKGRLTVHNKVGWKEKRITSRGNFTPFGSGFVGYISKKR